MGELEFVLLPGEEQDPLIFRCGTCMEEVFGTALFKHAREHGQAKFTVDLIPITGSRAKANFITFREGLEDLINSNSMENGSNTPDFLLAIFLIDCLKAFDKIVKDRDKWYLNGQQFTPAQTPAERAEWLKRIGEEGT